MHIQQHANSKTTVKEYCKVHHLRESSFYYYLKKYRSQANIGAIRPSLIPINIIPTEEVSNTESSLFAEVHGVKLYKPVSADYLLTLLKR